MLKPKWPWVEWRRGLFGVMFRTYLVCRLSGRWSDWADGSGVFETLAESSVAKARHGH